MAQVQIPPAAHWFGLEVLGLDGEWLRIDEEELGGKWWRIGTATPEQLAERAAGDAALTFRALFAPKDKRRSVGTSPPFQTGEEEHDAPPAPPATDAVPAPPVPLQADTAAAPPPQPAAPRPAPQRRHNGSNGRAHVQPTIPMPFNPPPNDPDLSRFVFLHQLVQQGNDRFLTLVLTMSQQAAEAERTRSQHMLESMRQHYSALAGGQERLTAALMAAQKGSEAPVIMQQLAQQAQHNAAALAQLGDKLQQYEDEDSSNAAALASMSENPNNVERVFAGITGIVGTVANTPLGDAIGDMLRKGPQPQGAAPYAPPAPDDDGAAGRTLDDFDDIAPPPQ